MIRNKPMTLELIHFIKAELVIKALVVENSLFTLKQFSCFGEILQS